MTRWSVAQEKAIYTENKNILVSASAGSGKTTVLIARLLHLVQDKRIAISQILAMTFTEAAANEMKKRLAKELQKALLRSENQQEQAFLQTQLANLSDAHISTIHGFCLSIIQNYYYTIDIDKERVENIIDESLQALLYQKSMHRTLNEYMDHPFFIQLATFFSTRPDCTQALESSILQLFHLANAKSDPYAFLATCQKEQFIGCINDMNENVIRYFYDYLMVQCDSILDSLQQILMFYEDEEDRQLVFNKRNGLQKAMQQLNDRQYGCFRKQFLLISKTLLASPQDKDAGKQLKKMIEELEATVHAILFEEKEFVSFSLKMQPLRSLLVEITLCFLNHYKTLKEANKCIDFNDMEQLALQILRANNGLVASLYREQFVEIMVDEFQDSNDVQDALVNAICKDNNVFRVGDIKQSIYKFRHATPAIMKYLIEHKNENDEIIYLSNNYRSKKRIVDFNNTLFDTLMNIQGFSSTFSAYDQTQIGLASQKEDNAPIVFHALQDKAINEGSANPLRKDELKASYIANQILTLTKDTSYSFRDIVVLIKTNAKADYLRDAFEAMKIPYFINMKHGFYDSSALMNVVSFLQLLHNPHDDIALCACLLSPFYQLKDADLVNARMDKNKDESYYTYFSEKTNILHAFHAIYDSLQNKKLSVILESIYHFNDYYEKHTTAQEKSNLDKLYEIVINQEKKEFVSITSFLSTLKQTKDTQIGEAFPIGNHDDVVRVMSIHQSKGLQFPVVFLYSIDSLLSMDTKGMVAYDDELPIALNYMDFENRLVYPTIERIALNHKLVKSALEEEMRVLYVATTRAQNELHIVDCKEDNILRPLNQAEIYQKKSFTSWILQAYANQNPLLEIRTVHEFWETPSFDRNDIETETIEKYTFAYEESYSHTPSTHDASYQPRKFDMKEDQALERGTQLHYMVEILPHHEWDLTLLKTVAKEQQLSLTQEDCQQLLLLNQNAVFKHSFLGTIYHEYPFMVSEQNDIIHGYMDYVSILTNEIILIDFKSDRMINEQQFKIQYQEQLIA